MLDKHYLINIPLLTDSMWLYTDSEEQRAETLVKVASLKAKAVAIVELLDLSVELNDCDLTIHTYRPLDKTSPIIVNAMKLLSLIEQNIKVEVVQEITLETDITTIISSVLEKHVEQALAKIGVSAGNTYNNKCDVHMPGNMLAFYNEVQLLEDSCSDALQEELTKGWRLIAACPQPDQRRPDYVLGRFNPNKEEDFFSANRGK